MPDRHALLGASSAHRWINCPPSARLEQDEPDTAGAAAAEGTAAHALAEWRLASLYTPDNTGARPDSPLEDASMREHIDQYVEFVAAAYERASTEAGEKAVIAIEQEVDFGEWVPQGFGTCDCVIITDGLLHVIDLKYGAGVQVEAEENPQLKLYALGAFYLLGMLFEIETVRLSIFQPRREHISTWELPLVDLLGWANETLRPAALAAWNGEGTQTPGSWCQFCKINATCRARAEQNLELARLEFQDPYRLEPSEVAAVLKQAGELKKWVTDIETWALNEALGGVAFPGLKLVEGRSVRRYTDEAQVEKLLRKKHYKVADIRQPAKLLTITAMEKLLGKTVFNELLGDLVIKPAGKPVLVPITDRRPAIQVESAEEEFTVITDTK